MVGAELDGHGTGGGAGPDQDLYRRRGRRGLGPLFVDLDEGLMDALGDIKALMLEQKRKAQAIDKWVDPPMLADSTG